MKNEIFKSERYFTLYDYNVGHGQLLLRSDKRKGCASNIDIIFYDTKFIQLFTFIKGLSIQEVPKEKHEKYSSLNNYLRYINNNLFKIKNLYTEEVYFIATSYLRVYKNDLEPNLSRLRCSKVEGEHELANSLD